MCNHKLSKMPLKKIRNHSGVSGVKSLQHNLATMGIMAADGSKITSISKFLAGKRKPANEHMMFSTWRTYDNEDQLGKKKVSTRQHAHHVS